MPIDSNIYFQQQPVKVEDQFNKLAAFGQIQQSQNQNKLAQLQFDRAQRQDASEVGQNKAISDAYDPATGKVDYTKAQANLAARGFGAAIPGLVKTSAEAAKAQREADMATIDQAIKKQAVIAQVAGAATDQTSWSSGKAQLAQMGIDVSQVPDQFDPVVAKQLQTRALTGVQQLDQHWKQMNYDLDVKKTDETGRHNVATEKNAAGQLGVAQGNLGVARSRLAFDQAQPKGVYDKDNGIIVDPRTGRSIAVSGPDGQPLAGGGGKLTEDQGKATGWLIQAENAYKNIQDAIKSTPSALKPGINDAIAAIPSFGIGEAVGNSMRGPDRQRVLQSTSSLSEALLRAATGAGVNRDEAIQKTKELTPVAGDSDAVIAQKMNAIPLYIDSLRVRAGPGAKKADQVLNNRPAAAAGNDGWSVREVK